MFLLVLGDGPPPPPDSGVMHMSFPQKKECMKNIEEDYGRI